MKSNHFKLADSSISISILCKKSKIQWIFSVKEIKKINLRLFAYIPFRFKINKTRQNRSSALSNLVPKTMFRDNWNKAQLMGRAIYVKYPSLKTSVW